MADWDCIDGLQVAIDGPSGSGKGTIAAMLGEELGLPVLDTGLLYRFTGWQADAQGVSLDDAAALLELLKRIIPSMEWHAEGIFFEKKDCTARLRGEDVGSFASKVASCPEVRQALLDVQRDIASHGCVMDGRDIGTVVLPDAQAKFFLTASDRERARRRWMQLRDRGEEVALDQIIADLKARDARDAERDCAPLQKAGDAIAVDSTTMRVDEVVDRMLGILERHNLIKSL